MHGKDADLWDEDEYYIVVDEFREQMSEYHMEFEKFSYCSGDSCHGTSKKNDLY